MTTESCKQGNSLKCDRWGTLVNDPSFVVHITDVSISLGLYYRIHFTNQVPQKNDYVVLYWTLKMKFFIIFKFHRNNYTVRSVLNLKCTADLPILNPFEKIRVQTWQFHCTLHKSTQLYFSSPLHFFHFLNP